MAEKKKNDGRKRIWTRGPKGEAEKLPGIYLLPGQLAVSDKPCAIRTILGSCISVCLWDSGRGIGGMCHFVLPVQIGQQSAKASGRFGNMAIPMLIEKLAELGSKRQDLAAKMFGGAGILGDGGTASRLPEHRVGSKNTESAVRILDQLQLPILARDVGGVRGRKVIFHPHDGTAWVREI